MGRYKGYIGLIALLLISCATVQKREPGTIGPCYGSFSAVPGTYSCLYDVDYDGQPDIVLTYFWTGEVLELFDARMIPSE